MSIAEAPVATLTIEQWYELYRDHEGGRCELVRGHAIMTPTEASQNSNAIRRLTTSLDAALGEVWAPLTAVSVRTGGGVLATVRVPDLLVLRAECIGPDWRIDPRDVALVVEVVSPSSVETDWVTKRGEYAAAGIPNYLIVDVRTPGEPRLWLFNEVLPATGRGADDSDTGRHGQPAQPCYADPTGDGKTATIHIPGADPITIVATDLV